MGSANSPQMHLFAVISAFVTAILLIRPVYKWIFKDMDDFLDCIKFSFTPDIVSMFRGRAFEDFTQSLKLSGFFLFTIGPGWLVYYMIETLQS